MRPHFWVVKRRLLFIPLILGVLWTVEVTVSKGPFAELLDSAAPVLNSIMLFVVMFVLGVFLAFHGASRDFTSSTKRVEPGHARVVLLVADLLAITALLSGAAAYDPYLGGQGTGGSIIGLVWAPAVLGSGAARLSMRARMTGKDWCLIVIAIVVSLLAGGRTVPTMIVIITVLRFFFIPEMEGAFRHVSVRWLLLCGGMSVALVISLVAFGAYRAQESGSLAFSPENLQFYGYEFGPPIIQYLHSTVGVIGEASRVVHAAAPYAIPFAGPGLLLQDVLSFMPGKQYTVTEATRDVYWAIGSPVFVSRPGGTVATMYMLGGPFAVAIGGAAYGALLALLLRIGSGSNGTAMAWFLLLASTFILGAYGTGTPTTVTLLAGMVSTVVFMVSPSYPNEVDMAYFGSGASSKYGT